MNSTTTLLNTQSFIDLENEFGAHNYEPLDIVLARGQGVWVWDVEGNKYLICWHRTPPSIRAIAIHAS